MDGPGRTQPPYPCRGTKNASIVSNTECGQPLVGSNVARGGPVASSGTEIGGNGPHPVWGIGDDRTTYSTPSALKIVSDGVLSSWSLSSWTLYRSCRRFCRYDAISGSVAP